MKKSALVRANFGVKIEDLSAKEFAELYSQALWLEGWRLGNQSEMLAYLFGGKN
ncbi:MAG: hypothetical protein LBJ17_01670 [Dysgonamonadaceae bacterium]|jgi:hypothetical protein|nr:hypothetical protein [Dysgonamonadaceae bacterium]